MASTVDAAFAKFLRDTINLAPEVSKGARGSRDWLRDRLRAFDGAHDDFPLSYAEQDIDFGSFARRTKHRELDDVDLVHCMKAEGATYLDEGRRVTITAAKNSRLAAFCFPETYTLNSRRVINHFVKHLNDIPQYSSAAAKRDGEAAVLTLASYSWNFDIVPGFFTSPECDGRTYYIIPDGGGHWKKTDPRLDRDRVSRANQQHDGHVLNVVRLLKYWNRRPTMPNVPSYAFENIIVGYYETYGGTASQYVDIEVPGVLEHLSEAIYSSIPDPKSIQGDLNTLESEDRRKVSERAAGDAAKARRARELEDAGYQKEAIEMWGKVFGVAFPGYTS